MKKFNLSIFRIAALSLVFVQSCGLLDSKEDLNLTDDMLKTRYYHLSGWGYRAYSYVPDGFNRIDGNLFASVSDEAQYYTTYSKSSRFNIGAWNQYNNPDDNYDWFYQGIHDVNYFLENTVDYVKTLAMNRDTITTSGKYQYEQAVLDLSRLRKEAIVLRSYYYFELMKRYGDVPFLDKTTDDPYAAREDYDSLVERIVKDIDSVSGELVKSWREENLADKDGRLTIGAAKAIKSRILLYAASPLHNPSSDVEKWKRAAVASHDVIAMNCYHLADSYRELFLTSATNTNPEVIWALRHQADNKLETANYPIGTSGGHTGICPSYNLVSSYEHKTSGGNFFDDIDPRFAATIITNKDFWNGRQMEIYPGGIDDPTKANVSVTGFYLKKFLNDNLSLINGATEIHSWIIFRYAEILLNYAEAMNEAFGPDDKDIYSLTAREAVNLVRSRDGVKMPDVVAGDKDSMRKVIKHERQIELAFEEHRFWDLLRWKDAETVLNSPVKGVVYNEDGGMSVKDVAIRKFDASKMYLYPIPQTEIVRTGNAVKQNPNW